MEEITIIDMRETLTNGYRLPTDDIHTPLRPVYGVVGDAAPNDNAIRSAFPADYDASCSFLASVLREFSNEAAWNAPIPAYNPADQSLIDHIFVGHIVRDINPTLNEHSEKWNSNVEINREVQRPWLRNFYVEIFDYIINAVAYSENHDGAGSSIIVTHEGSGAKILVPFYNEDLVNVLNKVAIYYGRTTNLNWVNNLFAGRIITTLIINSRKNLQTIRAAATAAAREAVVRVANSASVATDVRKNAVIGAAGAVAAAAVNAAFGSLNFERHAAAGTGNNAGAPAVKQAAITAAITAARNTVGTSVTTTLAAERNAIATTVATDCVNTAFTAANIPYQPWSISPAFAPPIVG